MVKRVRGFAGTKEKPYYAIKQPGGARKTFSVVAQWKEDGRVKSEIANINTVAGVNKLFLAEVLSQDQARQQIKLIIAQLYKERDKDLPSIVVASQNIKLLELFWTEEYEDRDIKDPKTMKNDFRRAIESIENLSLAAASKKELQDSISSKFKGDPTKQRRIIDRLNQLLKHCGRDFQLKKPSPPKINVSYLTLDDFKRAASYINDPVVITIAWVAFTTGMRTGEIFAANPDYLKQTKMFVDSQIDRDMQQRATKNQKDRWLVVLPEGEDHLKSWLTMNDSERERYRHKKFSEILTRACKKAFPGEPKKHITFHALRHSYAIHLLNKGVRIAHVAKLIGDSVAVCEKHYIGFQADEMVLDAVAEML